MLKKIERDLQGDGGTPFNTHNHNSIQSTMNTSMKTTRQAHNYTGNAASPDEINLYLSKKAEQVRGDRDRKALHDSIAVLSTKGDEESRANLKEVAREVGATAYIDAALSAQWDLNEVAKIVYASPYIWDKSMSQTEQDFANTCFWADYTTRHYTESAALHKLLPPHIRN